MQPKPYKDNNIQSMTSTIPQTKKMVMKQLTKWVSSHVKEIKNDGWDCIIGYILIVAMMAVLLIMFKNGTASLINAIQKL